jgi:hypothetical protein
MAQPMAFRAAYSDWRLIKTRGVVQVVLEVPLADADAAYNVLGGMPDASRENWFAVAPLKNPPAEKERKSSELTPATPQPTPRPPAAAKREKMGWRELQPAAQAGIRAGDPVFWKFLEEKRGMSVANGDEAAASIRGICLVQSRSELSSDHRKRVLWHLLDEQFLAWKHVDA